MSQVQFERGWKLAIFTIQKQRVWKKNEREEKVENHVALMHLVAVQLWEQQNTHSIYVKYLIVTRLRKVAERRREIPLCLPPKKFLVLNLGIDFLRRSLLRRVKLQVAHIFFPFTDFFPTRRETYKQSDLEQMHLLYYPQNLFVSLVLTVFDQRFRSQFRKSFDINLCRSKRNQFFKMFRF